MQRVDHRSSSATTPVTNSGTLLREPLRQHLEHGADEATAQRIWQGIERRLDGEPRALAARSGLAFATALIVIAVSGAIAWPYAAPRSLDGLANRATELWYGPRPLERAGGGAFESLDAETPGARRAEFSDGSSIEVDRGARVEALASSPSQFSLVVRRGRARFSVTPGGPRRWSIEARGVAIEVVGTILSVESSPGGVSVGVEVGAVIVRSAAFSDGVKRLSAGESVFVATEPETELRGADEAAAARATERAAPGDLPDASASTPSVPAPASPAPRQRARVPSLASARAESVRDLWSRADAARRAGAARGAAELLERIAEQHPDDARAPLAAFTLGTLLASDLGQPARAAVAFRRALALGLPEALRDSAYLKLASALRDAGDRAAVRAVASEYAKAHPDGEQRHALDGLARDIESP